MGLWSITLPFYKDLNSKLRNKFKYIIKDVWKEFNVEGYFTSTLYKTFKGFGAIEGRDYIRAIGIQKRARYKNKEVPNYYITKELREFISLNSKKLSKQVSYKVKSSFYYDDDDYEFYDPKPITYEGASLEEILMDSGNSFYVDFEFCTKNGELSLRRKFN